MTTKPVSPKFVDLDNVKESLATGMTVVHPYAPGLLQIIFTTPRHDPQAVADRRFSEAVSFAVVARIIIPTSEVAGLTELLNRQAAAERSRRLTSRIDSLRLAPVIAAQAKVMNLFNDGRGRNCRSSSLGSL